uniref:Dihydrolipoamide acetyltransferase component of pyruvate dehydrogenase complex n=1 Tax=Macrostomum lignano TaxID=282301 RepID=A0A1I8GRV8_9PLAT
QWRQLHTSRSLRGGVVTGKVPAFAESVTEGDIRWEKQVGDTVAEDELVAEVETDKTSVQVHSPCAGVITELLVPDGQKVVAHQEVFKIEAGGAAPAAAKSDKKAAVEEKPAAPQQQQPEQPKQPEQQAPAAPKEDKLVASQAPSKPPPLPQAAASSSASAPSTSTVGARSERRAAAYALQQQAAVNAVIDGGDIVYRDYVDISVAVATPKGLVVPVLRGVHNMNLADIEHEIAALGVKARKNELAIEDMDGGTFTISNGGVFGSLFGTPIINPPQSAILGMHGVFDRPMAVNGKVEIRPMMFVALTYDHRLIDGREAVTFLRKIKSFVEDPRILLLGL